MVIERPCGVWRWKETTDHKNDMLLTVTHQQCKPGGGKTDHENGKKKHKYYGSGHVK